MKRWVMTLGVLFFSMVWTTDLLAQSDTLPDSAYINGFIGHPQSYNLSCESRSAVDLAAFWGISIDETTFLSNLPRSDNPNVGFVGSAYDAWGATPPYSYGVHATPVAQLLRQYGLNASAHRGLSWDNLRREIVNGRPVIVWVIGSVWSGVPQSYATAGQTVTVAAYEHTMVLIGYDPLSVYLVDASTGLVVGHALSDFLSSWAVLGNMAVITGNNNTAGTTTYVIQPGDSLFSIAARFNVSWYELVTLNKLTTPDVIYVGQLLQLPAAITDAAIATPPTAAPSPDTSAVADTVLATYTVQPGEYLVQIARDLGLDWQVVAQFNNLHPPQYIVYPGQVLQLPYANISTVEPNTSAAPSPTTYIVEPGDTLFKIATRFGYDWPTLAQYNNIAYPYQIYTGQTLQIP